jgi:tRNA(Ile)-lysidine synthase
MGPGAAVADIRNAVRDCLADLKSGDVVLVACSGGADSVALAAALAFVGPRLGLRCGGVTVDHGLQSGSAERAAGVAGLLVDLKLDPVYNIAVTVADSGSPEAAARAARYRALDEVAGWTPRDEWASRSRRSFDPNGRYNTQNGQKIRESQRISGNVGHDGLDGAAGEDKGASRDNQATEDEGPNSTGSGPEPASKREPASERVAAILLGHTLDDQAETVLLGLARGAGARSLAGMAPRRGVYRRPLLGIGRLTTLTACAELGLDPWRDPHNEDLRFARARVRHQALPALEAALGPGMAQALARTARQLRADADCLDDLASTEGAHLRDAGSDPAELEIRWLTTLPDAIRTRVLRQAAIMAGSPAGSLSARHIQQVDELVTCWRGQRWINLPGGVRALRRYGKIWFTASVGRG